MASLDFDKEKSSFREYYSSNYPLLKVAEESFRTLIASLLAGNELFPTPVVSSRLKDRDECIRKFNLKYQTDLEEQQLPYEIKDYITDLIGLRVTCYYETDIPHISKILSDNFDIIDITDKTSRLESRDDTFGYKGLHLDLKLNAGRRNLPENKQYQDLRFEVQIRTIIQHAWSELDHKIKYKKSPPASLKRKINRLAALFELADQEFINIRVETEERERLTRKQSSGTSVSKKDNELSITVQYITNALKEFSVLEDKFLDVFQFLTIVEYQFPGYHFTPSKADGFVQEIRILAPEFTQGQLVEAIEKGLNTVKEYAEYQQAKGFNLNPFTIIRHILYLYNKGKFSSILFDMQRRNFEKWLEEHQS